MSFLGSEESGPVVPGTFAPNNESPLNLPPYRPRRRKYELSEFMRVYLSLYELSDPARYNVDYTDPLLNDAKAMFARVPPSIMNQCGCPGTIAIQAPDFIPGNSEYQLDCHALWSKWVPIRNCGGGSFGCTYLVRSRQTRPDGSYTFAVVKAMRLQFGTYRWTHNNQINEQHTQEQRNAALHVAWDDMKTAYFIGDGQMSPKVAVNFEALMHACVPRNRYLSQPIVYNNNVPEMYVHGAVCFLLSEPWGIKLGAEHNTMPRIRVSWRPPRHQHKVRATDMSAYFDYIDDDLEEGLEGELDRIPSWGDIMELTGQLLNGLRALHRIGFSHGDISEQNILLARPNCDCDIENSLDCEEPEEHRLEARFIDWGFVRFAWRQEHWLIDGHGDFVLESNVDRRQLDLFRVFAIAFRLKTGNMPHGDRAYYEHEDIDLFQAFRFTMAGRPNLDAPGLELNNAPGGEARRLFELAFHIPVNQRPTAEEWLGFKPFGGVLPVPTLQQWRSQKGITGVH